MSKDLHFLTIAEASTLIAARKLSPVDYVRALIARIQAIDPQLHAFVTVTPELAIEQAIQAEARIMAGNYRGPLDGMPFGLKDIYDTAGILTAAQSNVTRQRVPLANAEVVDRMTAAGAVLLGKLATHEFAHGGPAFDAPWPPARNPWNPEHFSGGSSSGSGVAVAAGLVPAGLGTDTGGSVRIPASLCGVAGLKPTYGIVSRTGVIPNSYTFDHCGPLAWSVEDCAILLSAMVGHDPRDPASRPYVAPDYRAELTEDIRGLRVGVIRNFWNNDTHPDNPMGKAMEQALAVLSGLGAQLEDLSLRPLQAYSDVKVIIAESELFSVHQNDFHHRLADFGSDFLGRTLGACLLSSIDYVQALRERRAILDEFEALYEKYDVLVTAGGGPAPHLDTQAGHQFADKWRSASTYTPFSVSGGPTLALCIGFSEQGLPLSMQISGRPYNDAMVLRVGHAYEKATPWRDRRPELVPGAAEIPVHPKDKARPATPIDPADRSFVTAQAQRAGLKLNDAQIDDLAVCAPFICAAAARIRRDQPWDRSPSNVFSFAPPAG